MGEFKLHECTGLSLKFCPISFVSLNLRLSKLLANTPRDNTKNL